MNTPTHTLKIKNRISYSFFLKYLMPGTRRVTKIN